MDDHNLTWYPTCIRSISISSRVHNVLFRPALKPLRGTRSALSRAIGRESRLSPISGFLCPLKKHSHFYNSPHRAIRNLSQYCMKSFQFLFDCAAEQVTILDRSPPKGIVAYTWASSLISRRRTTPSSIARFALCPRCSPSGFCFRISSPLPFLCTTYYP